MIALKSFFAWRISLEKRNLARRCICFFLHHDDMHIAPDYDQLWLSGDRQESSQIYICKRCFKVKRRFSRGKIS